MNLNNKSVEICFTTTNKCNCRCKYCFETSSCQKEISENVMERSIYLLDDFLKNKYIYNYDNLKITFWGGEPMMNFEYIKNIFNHTINFNFVNYFLFSNGILHEKYIEFLNIKNIEDIKKKISIQLSYDGEPQNSALRGEYRDYIIKTAKMLFQNGIVPSLKSTLSYEYIPYFDQMWKSYEELEKELGFNIGFAPSLEFYKDDDNYIEEWKHVLINIFRYELEYYKKYGRYLLWWLNNPAKIECCPNNQITIDIDGNVYICQNNPFCDDNKKSKTILGNIFNINNLSELFKINVNMNKNNVVCENCPATFCNKCHMKTVDLDNLQEDWILCQSRDSSRCKYFQIFGIYHKYFQLKMVENGLIKQNIDMKDIYEQIYNHKCLIGFNNNIDTRFLANL